ncbi:MAG TPA: carboxymuconolactone decarboxylase family protein [Geobacteraceae bacterium]
MAKQPSKTYLKLKEQHPTVIDALEMLRQTTRHAGPLPIPTVQLVQLAAAATSRSEGAVRSHVQQALEAGATPDEIRHTLLVLISTIGFPTVAAALSWAGDILDK